MPNAATVDKPTLTIGMACHDNYDETWATVQVLRFRDIARFPDWRIDIGIVDNNPDSAQGQRIKALIEGRCKTNTTRDGKHVGHCWYVPFTDRKGSCPPRGHLFTVAKTDWVVCIDSHVFFDDGGLDSLLEYIASHPMSDDLLHGPIMSNYGPHRIEGSHMTPVWRNHMFGTWCVDDRAKNVGGEAFDIPQHGLGFWAARRESWLGFNESFDGFSGGEGYIHQKYRDAGRRVLCIPGARWVHSFADPKQPKHRVTVDDKIRNHVRGWSELQRDLQTGDTDDPLKSIRDHWVGGVGTKDGKGIVTADRFDRLCADVNIAVSHSDRATCRRVAIGPLSFGSFQLLAGPLIDSMGFETKNSRGRVEFDRNYDVAHVCKSGVTEMIRQHADRVVWQPVDLWVQSARPSDADLSPAEWMSRNGVHRADLVIAATPAMRDAAESLGIKSVLIPHYADPRVQADWYDPSGPVVYAGDASFLGGLHKTIAAAVAALGSSFVCDASAGAWSALQGASLVLAPRLGKSASRMNLEGKPTIKLANAAQAGIPSLATPDAACVDLFPDVTVCSPKHWSDATRLAEAMQRAIERGPSKVQFPFSQWREKMESVLS